jgi:serine/threonine protein kinase
VAFLLVTFLCVVCIVTLSAGSFYFWKRKYDKKIKTSATFLKNFGIDLSKPSALPMISLDKWEVPKDRVVINRRLGDGAFGTVYGGEAQIEGPDAGWTAVAVKTLKVGSTTEDKVDFLAEAEVMKRFDHKNIIKLLGVCLQTEPVFTIMEFMLYGDLKTFLLARRNFVNAKPKEGEDSDISPKRLTMMAIDVARALSYLAEQKYVHRDLACRNCLINAQRVVKLGDFGMARSTYENDYYRFNRKGMLPVRWMSPEALQLGLFTPSSDIWSYGVLLYEIITFGGFPYQGLTNNQVLEKLKQGGCLTIPHGVKPQLEALLKSCWNQNYKVRPAASEIVEYLSAHPRILAPCLDVPLSAVQMAETESDELELLPGLRKRTSTLGQNTKLPSAVSHSTLMSNQESQSANIQPSAAATQNGYMPHNDMFQMTNHLAKGVKLHEFVSTLETFPNRDDSPQNGMNSIYNPIEPLIQPSTTMPENPLSISHSSLLRYVPMFSFGRTRSIGLCSQLSGGSMSNGVKSTSTGVL